MRAKSSPFTSVVPSELLARRMSITYKWYQNPDICKKIVKLAKTLVNSYQGARVFSLGQPSSWVVKVAEKVAKYENKKQTHDYLAFSGSLVSECASPGDQSEETVGRKKSFIGVYRKSFTIKDSLTYEKQYRAYLQAKKMSPSEIIAKASEGNKTVVVECMQQGEVLASFLYVLFRWADEEGVAKRLKSSVDIVVLCQDYCEVRSIGLVDISLIVELQSIKITACLLQSFLFAKDDEASADRLVPSYSPHQWREAPMKLKNDTFREKIERQIEEDVKGFYLAPKDDMSRTCVCCVVS